MARLGDLPQAVREWVVALECPRFESVPWIRGRPLAQRRVALISTAGLQRASDARFAADAADYRVIPGDTDAADLVMSHISSNFDRTGFQQDVNVMFPVDRLAELADEGIIGSVAAFHYAFMGATAPEKMEPAAREVANLLQRDEVDLALLVPV
jgi:D-proline reductase (dithiol) PrdB